MTIANAEYSQHEHDEQYLQRQLDWISPLVAEIEEQADDEGFVQAFVMSTQLAEFMREEGFTDIQQTYESLLQAEADYSEMFMAAA